MVWKNKYSTGRDGNQSSTMMRGRKKGRGGVVQRNDGRNTQRLSV
jgi:hypothetical protein